MRELIFVCEDEPDIQNLISYNLVREGFRTRCISRGELILDAVKLEKPDVILLDVMLPNKNGIEVCKAIRSTDEIQWTPIILVSARTSEIDRVLGLQSGADDYVTKPFSMAELVARVNSALRRARSKTNATSFGAPERKFMADRLRILTDSYKVYLDGGEVGLTLSEFKIFLATIQAEGRVLSRDDLGALLDRENPVAGRTIDVHIVSLRKKLGPACHFVETIRGVGYRFKNEVYS